MPPGVLVAAGIPAVRSADGPDSADRRPVADANPDRSPGRAGSDDAIGRAFGARERFGGLEGSAVATHSDREVVLHDLTNLRLTEELVGSKRVFDARCGIGAPGRDEAEVLRRVRVLPQLAESAGELGCSPERRHPVATDQPRDGRVVNARLLGELPLRHLLGFELGPEPFVERSSVLSRHLCLRAPWNRRDEKMMRRSNYPPKVREAVSLFGTT